MRGEQTRCTRCMASIVGSPPLARGTASEAKKEWKRIGITPACAGNSGSFGVQRCRLGDHPRLRGEQRPCKNIISCLSGSPPLARGTAGTIQVLMVLRRITPACAGNRPCTPIMRYTIRDHPRLRGEQSPLNALSADLCGSPPLARGTGTARSFWNCAGGITPACAGNRPQALFCCQPP